MDLLSQISFTLMDLLSEYVKKEKKEKRKKDWDAPKRTYGELWVELRPQ